MQLFSLLLHSCFTKRMKMEKSAQRYKGNNIRSHPLLCCNINKVSKNWFYDKFWSVKPHNVLLTSDFCPYKSHNFHYNSMQKFSRDTLYNKQRLETSLWLFDLSTSKQFHQSFQPQTSKFHKNISRWQRWVMARARTSGSQKWEKTVVTLLLK